MAGIAELLWQQNVQQAPQRNDSDASRFIVDALMEAGGKLGAASAGIAQALMAPGNALRGEYDQREISPDGRVSQFDPRMMDDATELAGTIGLSSMPIPRPTGSLGMGGIATKSPAQEVAEMLSSGRASQVTDEMMAAADPSELWRLYESGATGQAMPMDTASRMARAKDMGFDVDTTMYHGTGTDFHRFDPYYRGGVADAYSARKADWITDSPTTAQGYADMAAKDAPVARLVKASEAAERDGKWDQAHELMVQAEALEASMPELAGQRMLPLVSKRPRTLIDADGGGVNDLETSMRDAISEARKSGDAGIEIANFSDHPDYSVTDPALHRGIFNAADIRSKFARFDPRLKHLGNLSAGVGGIAVVGGTAEESMTTEQQQIIRMLFGN